MSKFDFDCTWRSILCLRHPAKNGRATPSHLICHLPVDAALVLCAAQGAAQEGVEFPDALPFEEWIATIAIPAALELRDISDAELRR